MSELVPTEEESRLLWCFSNEWDTRSPKYKILGTRVEHVDLTESGVVASIEVTGQSQLEDIRKNIDRVRSLLDVLDSDIVDVLPGGRGSRVQVAVRTRRVTDGMDMLWHPGITSLGIDMITGEEIPFPWDQRLLVSGSSGSGKSRSMRPLMARCVVDPLHTVSAFVDGKGEDATEWRDVVPCAVDDDEIIDAIELEHEEMLRRQKVLRREGIGKWDLLMGPRRLFVTDEGQKVISLVKEEDKRRGKIRLEDEEYDPYSGDKPVEQKFIELSSMARTKEIIMLWGTQYPIVTGQSPGITNLIRANFDYSFCLRTASAENTDVALGKGAGVFPHKLPRGESWVLGAGYLSTHNSNLIKTWDVPVHAIQSLRRFR